MEDTGRVVARVCVGRAWSRWPWNALTFTAKQAQDRHHLCLSLFCLPFFSSPMQVLAQKRTNARINTARNARASAHNTLFHSRYFNSDATADDWPFIYI